VGDKHFRPEEEEDVDKIVRAVMRGFDAELAVLLLLLSPSDSTGLKKSLDKVDLHNVLMVCIRVIHAIFQEDGSLVEGVLKQVTVVVLLRLGMENDRAKFVAEAIPWHKIKVTLKDDFNQQRRPPLKFVMQRAVEILSSVVKQDAENEAIQEGRRSVRRARRLPNVRASAVWWPVRVWAKFVLRAR
jgi:hypothetical protein